jgi:hypothetical protein
MIDGPRRYWEYCSLCGMQKLPPSSRLDRSWLDDHEEIACPKGTIVFCFREGNPAETFWEFLRRVTDGLGAKSCTSSAIENQRAPEWIRECALEEMTRERNSRARERFETIASFCKRRADELAQELYASTLTISAVFGTAALAPRPAAARVLPVAWDVPAWLREWEAFYQGPGEAPPRGCGPGGSEAAFENTVSSRPSPVEAHGAATSLPRLVEVLFELTARQADLLTEVAMSPCACPRSSASGATGEERCGGQCLPARARRLSGHRTLLVSALEARGRLGRGLEADSPNQSPPQA